MLIGIRAQDLGRLSPEAVAGLASAKGCQAVHLNLEKVFVESAEEVLLSEEFLLTLFHTFYGNQIRIALLDCQVRAGSDDSLRENRSVDRFKSLLRASIPLGAICVETGTAEYEGEGDQREAAYRRVVDFCREVLKEARKLCAIVGIRPSAGQIICTPEIAGQLVADCQDGHLAMVLDLAGMLTGELSDARNQQHLLERCISSLGRRICAVIVRDGRFDEKGCWKECPLGEGVMDWENLLPQIQCSYEYLPLILEGSCAERLQEDCERMRGWLGA